LTFFFLIKTDLHQNILIEIRNNVSNKCKYNDKKRRDNNLKKLDANQKSMMRTFEEKHMCVNLDLKDNKDDSYSIYIENYEFTTSYFYIHIRGFGFHG